MRLQAGGATAADGTTRRGLAPPVLFTAGLLLPALAALLLILVRNDGQLDYALDGPYVHMALAEHIRQGHYGLVAGEPSSPSSSILFPFLLALLPFGDWSPLLVDLLAVGACGALLAEIALEAGIGLDRLPPLSLALLGASLALALNLSGVALMGLEHAPQAALTLASLLGLTRFLHRRVVAAWWPVVLVLLPLLRFETAPLVGAQILVLLLFGRWRPALATVAGILACVGAFGLYLHSLGLPPVPSSVLERSMVAGADSGLGQKLRILYTNLRVNLLSHGGTHLLVALVVLGWGAARAWGGAAAGRREQAQIAAAVVFAAGALGHMVGGSLISVSRYEVYLLALAIAAMLVVFDREVAAALARPATRLALCLSILVIGAGYTFRTVDIVKRAQAIHRVDDQAWRFVVERWQGPTAATRYGRLNYRNPWPVAQLPTANAEIPEVELEARASAIAARHGVRLAVLTDHGGTVVPPAWQPVGRISSYWIGREHAMTFYAVDPAAAPALRQKLRDFAATVPRDTVLRVFAEGETGG